MLTEVRTGRPFDQALNAALADLDDQDRRLAHELAAGVFRGQRDLDARLRPLAHHGWASVDPVLRDILRLGAYQLATLDRIPAHAAVSTSVSLARAALGEKAARFVNAMLRQMGGRAAPPALEADAAANLADRFSHPDWLVRRWLSRFGVDQTERLLQWNNTRPGLVVQPARWSLAQLQQRFWETGVGARPAPHGAGLALDSSRPIELPGYAEGGFLVQDPAQALVARFAAPPAGALVYDACAAPGGKTLAFGSRAVRVLAGDYQLTRVRRLRENIRRAGTGREFAVVATAEAPPLLSADLVLLDAPCLGTGSLARHPDARWRTSPEALVRLAEKQQMLLQAVAAIVRPGGWLVYATCSLEPEENEDQVRALLSANPELQRDPGDGVPAELLTSVGDLQLFPQRHGVDGAFASRLRRAA